MGSIFFSNSVHFWGHMNTMKIFISMCNTSSFYLIWVSLYWYVYTVGSRHILWNVFCIISFSFYHHASIIKLLQYVYTEKKKYWQNYETNHFKIHTNTAKLSKCHSLQIYRFFLCYFWIKTSTFSGIWLHITGTDMNLRVVNSRASIFKGRLEYFS